MKRAILLLTGVLCVVVVTVEAAGLGVLWYQGRLNRETFARLTAVLSGQEDEDDLDLTDSERVDPSSAQVMQQRIARTFDLGVRETELMLLKSMISEKRHALLADMNLFENQKREFEQGMATLREQLGSEASEQTRSVLTGLTPADSVNYLMGLDLEQNVVLLKGMAPKAISSILKEFSQPESLPEVRERGAAIFEALSQGTPETELVDAVRDELSM